MPVVQQYVDGGLLTHTASTSLQKELEAALQQAEKGNDTAAVNQLNAFVDEASALVSTHRLSADDGAYLTNWAVVARTLILAG